MEDAFSNGITVDDVLLVVEVALTGAWEEKEKVENDVVCLRRGKREEQAKICSNNKLLWQTPPTHSATWGNSGTRQT